MVRVELDITLWLIEAEVRDDLVSRRLRTAVRRHSRDVQLRRARRDVDDALWAGCRRGQSEELANQMEQADDIDGVVRSEVLGLDSFCRVDRGSAFEAGGVGSAGDEDVDFADRLDDLGHAWEVRLRSGVGLDFGVWVRFLE